MWTQTRKSIRNTLPLSNWTLAVAAVAGLALGSIHLNESLDLATAVGIACFLSVAIGLWLAIHLYRLLIHGYTGWIIVIKARADSILERLPVASDGAGQEEDSAWRVPITVRLVGYSFYLTMFSFGAFTTCLLAGIFMMQIDGPGYGIYFAVAMVSFGIVDVSLGTQCLYIWYLRRKVAAIERQVERTVAVPQVAGGAAVLDASISRTEQFSLRFVGIKPSSPERTTI